MKSLLSMGELIAHMKNKGITFNNISEDEAKAFLYNHNYYKTTSLEMGKSQAYMIS